MSVISIMVVSLIFLQCGLFFCFVIPLSIVGKIFAAINVSMIDLVLLFC